MAQTGFTIPVYLIVVFTAFEQSSAQWVMWQKLVAQTGFTVHVCIYSHASHYSLLWP